MHAIPSTSIQGAPLLAPAVTKSLALLQMPILELSEWVQKELQENPFVEFLEESSLPILSRIIEKRGVVEQRDPYTEVNLTAHLESQARLFFNCKEDLQNALNLIGNLDERGFLPKEIPDSSVVRALQSFDPSGICGRSLQESLILQLRDKELTHSLALLIIEKYFDDLIHHRFVKIRKQLRCSIEDFYTALHVDIATLSLNPASRFNPSETIFSIPDITLCEEEGTWQVEVNESLLPRVRLDKRLVAKMREAASTNECKEYAHKCYKQARDLLLSVKRRSMTLLRLGRLLLHTQLPFLEGRMARPVYLSIREVADEIKLHPSTVARAIAHKHVSCSYYGIVPLHFFFRRPTSCSAKAERDIGEAIALLITKENPIEPLTDENIAGELQRRGILCARRTVAKYRKLHDIPPAFIRKKRDRAQNLK